MLRKISRVLLWAGIALACIGGLGLLTALVANLSSEKFAVGTLLVRVAVMGVVLTVIGGFLGVIASASSSEERTRSKWFMPLAILLSGIAVGLHGVLLLAGSIPLPAFHQSSAGSGDPQGSMYDGIGVILIQLPLAVLLILLGLFLIYLLRKKRKS